MPEWLIALITLTALEIVLGIDNIIFLTIVAGKLPKEEQPRARKLGLGIALGTRLLLLLFIQLLMQLTEPLFTLPELPFFSDTEAREISLKDLILLVGGMFLIGKSTYEIHEKLEGEDPHMPTAAERGAAPSFQSVLVQIVLIDLIFSLDSVITAVGMARDLWVMMVAMVIAVVVMLLLAKRVSDFVHRHPTFQMLALSFLILIGVMLMAEGLGQEMNKNYIYFAMAFSVVVELLNMQLRRRAARPVALKRTRIPETEEAGVAST